MFKIPCLNYFQDVPIKIAETTSNEIAEKGGMKIPFPSSEPIPVTAIPLIHCYNFLNLAPYNFTASILAIGKQTESRDQPDLTQEIRDIYCANLLT